MTATNSPIMLLVILQVKSSENPDKTRQGWYAAAAFTYVAAMVCGNMALRYITYPTQVIAKSSKPIPVMLIGVLLAHKRYTVQKYFFVLMIVVGVILFIYKDGKAKDGDANNNIGLILIGMSLLSDGVLGAIEDRMRAATKPSAFNFMFSINMYSAIFLVIGAVATGEVVGFYEFASKYPEVLFKIGSAAFVGSFGQIFIFMMISEFGPLPCSIVTTTRKFFTVLISVIFMGNALSGRQQIATLIVFGALFADALWGKKKLCGKPDVQAVPTEEPEADVEKNGAKSIEMETLKSNKTSE
jgi:solute carrier family 35 (UDP-galactose transporter), member B1